MRGYDNSRNHSYQSGSQQPGGYQDRRGSNGGYDERRGGGAGARQLGDRSGFEVRRETGYDERRTRQERQERQVRRLCDYE